MTDVSTLTAQLRELQGQLVGALQAEHFCDDLAPPPEAFGWDELQLRSYFESGGDVAEKAAPAGSSSAGQLVVGMKPAMTAVVSGQPGGGREQAVSNTNPAVDMPALAQTLKALVGGDGIEAAMRYQQSVIAAGIPDLQAGCFSGQ